MGLFRRFLLLSVLLALVSPVFAAASKPGDLRDGEEYQIQKRHEWFYSTRHAGLRANQPIGQLRWQAIEYTRQQMAQQRKARGGKMPTALWISRGPSSSDFGGWQFGKVSGRVVAMAKDWANNIVYTGAASGGLWKSTDDGASWTSLFDSAGTMTVGEIAIDPNNSQVLWVGTGENSQWCEEYFGIGLLRSTDGGATWELRNGTGSNTLEDIAAVASIVIDPDNSDHILVGGAYRDCTSGIEPDTPAGIYTTTDAGLNWVKRLTGVVTEIVQDPNNHQVFWAGVDPDGVYKSTDSGATWNLSHAGTGRSEVTVAPSNSNYIYELTAASSSNAQFWRSTNGGANWTQMSSGSNACDGQCWYNMVIRVTPNNADTIYRGTIHIYKSINGGTSWTDLSGPWGQTQKVHQDTHEFVFSPTDGNTFYVGCDGGVWKTTDGGNTFTNLNANLNITQFYAIGNHPSDDGTIIGGAQDNGSLARTSSDTWDLQWATGDGFVCHINPANPDYVYAASYPYSNYPSVYRSTAGVFGYYNKITNGHGIDPTSRINWVTPYLVDPITPNVMYLGTYRVYKSINNGTDWTGVSPDVTGGSGNIVSLEINRSATNYIYTGSQLGKIWRSSDAGTTWNDVSDGLPVPIPNYYGPSINDIAADPVDTDKAFCVIGGFSYPHFYVFDGTSWTAAGEGLPDVPANTAFVSDDHEIYVGTDVGIYRSNDGGVSFAPFMDGMPQGVVVTDLKYTSATHTLTAGTYGRGAWQIPLQGCGVLGVLPAILPNGSVGVPYSQTISAIGGAEPYTFAVTAGALPPGLTLDGSTGLLSGAPTTLGAYSFDITATDSVGCAGTRSYSVSICVLITISPGSLPGGTVGTAYSQAVAASGGTAPYTYTIYSGSLPGGLSLNPASGLISGTPTAAGAFNFTVKATDAIGCSATQSYSVNICGNVTLAPPTLPPGIIGTYYVQSVFASGGAAPYTYSVSSGNLPAGLTLETNGSIHGTPTTTGVANFEITATDSQGCPGTKAYSIAICGTITVSPADLPGGATGAPYSAQLSAAGGAPPYTYSVSAGALPAGLSLHADTGMIDGTPAAMGTANVTIMATDSGGCHGTKSYSISIVAGCLFCDDFEDGVLDMRWTYLKPAWTEADGSLIGTPSGRKAIAIATPVFDGCSSCSVEAYMQTAGGAYNKVWLLAFYQDKADTVEVLLKQESGRWILRQRSGGAVIAKTKAIGTILPNVSYRVEVAYSAGALTLSVGGTLVATLPTSVAPIGTVGFQVKNTVGAFDSIFVSGL